MTLIGHWVAADAGGTGTSLPDRSAFADHGTLSAGCTWGTVSGEAVVRCPVGEQVTVPDAARWTLGDFTVIVRLVFNVTTAGGNRAWLSHSEGAGAVPKWVMDYGGVTGGTTTSVHWQTANRTVSGDGWTPTTGVIYALGIRRSGSTFHYFRDRLLDGKSTDANAFSNAAATLKIGAGGEAFFDNDSDFSIVSLRMYDSALTNAEVLNAMYEDAGETPPALNGVSGLIGHWVVADAGATGTLVPDRSVLGNHAEWGNGVNDGCMLWASLANGCSAVECQPSGCGDTPQEGAWAPWRPDYDVTDFTLIVCFSIGDRLASEFDGVMCQSPGAVTGGPKWVFGVKKPGGGFTKDRLALYLSGGNAEDIVYSSEWPVALVAHETPTGTGGMYVGAVRRATNTFSFFWGASGTSTQTTATSLGTDTATEVVGSTIAPVKLAWGGEDPRFSCDSRISWAAYYNTTLSDQEILDIIDLGIPECGDILAAARRHRNSAWVDQIMVTAAIVLAVLGWF